MSISLPNRIFNVSGQAVKKLNFEAANSAVVLVCCRDKRVNPKDPLTGQPGTVNRYIRRRITDLPFCGCRGLVEVELAQVRTSSGIRRIEHSSFSEKGCLHSNRFCRLVSGLCRHMTIQSVAQHFELRW